MLSTREHHVTSLYKVQECAALAGVTVKALYHYERMGLLTPTRTDAGYRLYGLQDVQRLQRITALNFIGLPLKQIQTLLEPDSHSLPEALRAQREVLEEQRELLDRAIDAIQRVEQRVPPGGASNGAILSALIGVISMGDPEQAESAWNKWEAERQRRRTEAAIAPPRAGESWIAFFRDVQASLDEDPAGARAKELVAQYRALVEQSAGGDPDAQSVAMNPWAGRRNWPAGMRRYVASLYTMSEETWEQVVDFIDRASGRWY